MSLRKIVEGMPPAREVDVCLECGATMTLNCHRNCPACDSEQIVPSGNIAPDKLTQAQKDFIIQQDETQRAERRLQQEIDAQQEHPVGEDGEPDYTSPKNNSLVPGGEPEKPYDPEDYTDSRVNSLIPGSTAPPPKEAPSEPDYTSPEINPLVPKL